MKFFKPALLTVCLSLSLMVGANAAEPFTIAPLKNVPADFIKGADISTLAEVERQGGKFFNEQNVQQDAMAILKANGVNYVRLRLWVDPKDSDGQSYGGGSNDLATTLALAKRAKAQGLKVLLDFHYSDFWTDPGKQFKPKAWQKMNYDQLKVAIHDYTRDTIATFKKEGVLPDMVQIGNESNGGLLWPEGKSWGEGGGEFDRLAGLLNAAIGGLRENLSSPSDVKIMLHLAEGTKNDTFHWWFDEITNVMCRSILLVCRCTPTGTARLAPCKPTWMISASVTKKMSSSWKPLMAIPWKIVITPKIALPLKKRKMGVIPERFKDKRISFMI